MLPILSLDASRNASIPVELSNVALAAAIALWVSTPPKNPLEAVRSGRGSQPDLAKFARANTVFTPERFGSPCCADAVVGVIVLIDPDTNDVSLAVLDDCAADVFTSSKPRMCCLAD
jgi:hypothetical protein